MRSDREGRFFISKELREISRIEPGMEVAVMYKNPTTVYLIPKDKDDNGKLLGFRTVEKSGRISLSRFLTKQEDKEFNYVLYLQKGIIYVEKLPAD